MNQPSAIVLRVCNFVATGFYSGRTPRAPGTAGTAVAFALFALMDVLNPAMTTPSGALLLTAVTALIGIYVSNVVCRAGLYGTENHDPKPVVIDEFAGSFLTLAGINLGLTEFVIAFCFFRLFDITKLYPASRLERLPLGWGIVMDDLAAGVYANIATRLVLSLLL